jgi:hypothetical protein
MMPGGDRKDLAVQALARSATVSDLSTRHGVSRKFVYQQANKARHALDDAFLFAATDDTVLFQIQVTKRWLRQVIVALALMCRSSYLGIIEFMHDVLGWPISIGTILNVLHAAAEQAGVINGAQDLSCRLTQRQDVALAGRTSQAQAGRLALANKTARIAWKMMLTGEAKARNPPLLGGRGPEIGQTRGAIELQPC